MPALTQDLTPALTIAPIYMALNVMVFVVLAMWVVHYRIENRVRIGDGGVSPLFRAIRVHGNFIEYTPFAMVLLAVLELNGLNAIGLHAVGGGFTLARVMHAYGLGTDTAKDKVSLSRQIGALTSLIWLMVMAGLLVLQAVGTELF